MQRLVGQLAGLLVHERERAPAAGAKDERQQTEHQAEQRPACQQRQRVPAAEHPAADAGAEALHRPASANVDLRALRSCRSPPAAESDVREGRVIAERHRDIWVTFECSLQHQVGHEQLAEPSDEGAPATGDRGWHDPAAIHRRRYAQRGVVASDDGRVVGLPRVPVDHQGRRERAVVDARGQVARRAAGQAGHGQAVVAPRARWLDLNGPRRSCRLRAQRSHGVGGEAALECRQPGRRHELHQADVLQLREALHRVHRFCPAVEAGGRSVRIASDERARVHDQVFLVLDRKLQRGGDLRRCEPEREARFVDVRARHGAGTEHRCQRPRQHQHSRHHRPPVPAPRAQRVGRAPERARARARPRSGVR